MDFSQKYPDANQEIIYAMVRMHDFPKILGQKNSEEILQTQGKGLLVQHGYNLDTAQKIIQYIMIMDRKIDLDKDTTPIEIKIVSSADGASHMIGPFQMIWFYENPEKNIDELLASSLQKLEKDRTRKIVLPEVRARFEKQYEALRVLVERESFMV